MDHTVLDPFLRLAKNAQNLIVQLHLKHEEVSQSLLASRDWIFHETLAAKKYKSFKLHGHLNALTSNIIISRLEMASFFVERLEVQKVHIDNLALNYRFKFHKLKHLKVVNCHLRLTKKLFRSSLKTDLKTLHISSYKNKENFSLIAKLENLERFKNLEIHYEGDCNATNFRDIASEALHLCDENLDHLTLKGSRMKNYLNVYAIRWLAEKAPLLRSLYISRLDDGVLRSVKDNFTSVKNLQFSQSNRHYSDQHEDLKLKLVSDDPLCDIPVELQDSIFQHLSSTDVLNSFLVCKEWSTCLGQSSKILSNLLLVIDGKMYNNPTFETFMTTDVKYRNLQLLNFSDEFLVNLLRKICNKFQPLQSLFVHRGVESDDNKISLDNSF